MTIEEKARAYDKALERARKLYNSEETSADVEIACETIFPELAESEDERIRKTIIRFFKDQYSNETEMYDGSVTVGKAIAWLEKQSKPKWSEEDEERLQSCIIELQGKGLMGGVDTMDSKWLKSLKQRMEEQ